MDRVVERADRIDPEWRAGDIHDLRVALRRCRTMAETLSEVVPDPGWRKLKKASRELFHALGNLRDTQVERALIKKLETPGDPLRKYMLRHLGREEKKQRNAAQKALESFDRKNWRKSSRKLSSKAQFFPVESVVFQRIALAMLNEAAHLYQSAREKKSSVAWHKTRIGIKRFRYVVENFLPQRHEVWAKDLKQMQDLLGDLHDMDVPARRYSAALEKIRSGGYFGVARKKSTRSARDAFVISWRKLPASSLPGSFGEPAFSGATRWQPLRRPRGELPNHPANAGFSASRATKAPICRARTDARSKPRPPF